MISGQPAECDQGQSTICDQGQGSMREEVGLQPQGQLVVVLACEAQELNMTRGWDIPV